MRAWLLSIAALVGVLMGVGPAVAQGHGSHGGSGHGRVGSAVDGAREFGQPIHDGPASPPPVPPLPSITPQLPPVPRVMPRVPRLPSISPHVLPSPAHAGEALRSRHGKTQIVP